MAVATKKPAKKAPLSKSKTLRAQPASPAGKAVPVKAGRKAASIPPARKGPPKA
jgi:hypothetical protein